ncbi:MAG: hypothetical protein ACYDIE_02590 [Candidatus Krumholzibacteriia bacterium]
MVGFGTDYLPRIDFHPGEGAADLCAVPLPGALPGTVALPLYAYNLQGEASGARLRLVASAEITDFQAAPGVVRTRMEGPRFDGQFWSVDLELSGSLCGPAQLGELQLLAPAGATTLFADVAGFGGSGAPTVTNTLKGELPAVSPRHGAYAGAADLYHCQPPLCREPHAPVQGLTALQSGGFVIELGWTAGDGEFTMIRYRSDGVSPTSVFDGDLLTVMPTVPGQSYAVIHENPEYSQYWYTAFSVSLSGDTVTLGSRLECDSFTTASVDPSIPTTDASWGAVKNSYR